MRKLAVQPRTTDEYLAAVDPEKRAALEKLRKTILSVVPKAEECISYGMPGVRVDGRVLVWFAAATHHCAFYPGGTVKQFARELADFATSKGTIRFQPDRPLPARLVRQIVKTRVAQNAAKKPAARTQAFVPKKR
jgi:uncharacterized protein YdhG (YjbR/CyaY superfamily)